MSSLHVLDSIKKDLLHCTKNSNSSAELIARAEAIALISIAETLEKFLALATSEEVEHDDD